MLSFSLVFALFHIVSKVAGSNFHFSSLPRAFLKPSFCVLENEKQQWTLGSLLFRSDD